MKKEFVAIAAIVLATVCFVLGKHSTANSETIPLAVPTARVDQSHVPYPYFALTAGKTNAGQQHVQTEPVRRNSESGLLRITGKVTVDENRTYRLIAGTDGRLNALGNNPAGTIVHREETLATFFSNELIKAQQAYFFSLQSLERDKASGKAAAVRQSEESVHSQEETLCAMGMSEPQVRKLAQTRVATRDIEIASPINGIVVSRNLSPQQPLQEGMELYRIVDLTSVWILSNVLPGEIPSVHPGSQAKVIVRRTGKTLPARVSSAVPLFNAESRVLELKLEVENRELALLPDMLVDVEFDLPAAPGIFLPAQAVIDSGLQKIVYVQSDEHGFEPRGVELGSRLGDRVQIRRGLSENERVVVGGNFLIDSESRVRRRSLQPGDLQ